MTIAALDSSHLPILLIVGFAMFAGTIGARLFQRLRTPQVVGYIAIGVLIGKSGLGIISDTAIDSLLAFNYFALGVIGFLIGGELRAEVFRRHGGQFLVILFVQGIGAFLVVSVLVGLVAFLVTHQAGPSVALGLVFGAISSATAPAATVNVLWEYKTRGPLTTAIYAIVALDDGLALMLFALALSIATRLTGAASGGGVFGMLGHVAREIFGAAALGAAAGYLLNFILRRLRDPDRALTFTIGMVALVLGAALALGLDLILAAMSLGVALANLAPRRSQRAFEVVERFAAPIYVVFFVVVGARVSLTGLEAWMWLLALPYMVGRIAAKVGGAYLGGRWAGAVGAVRKYLGWCLFCQGGVAIGLSIIASQRFGGQLGAAIVTIVAATTFVVEMVGPACVKIGVKRAGEVGLDVTKEDLMRSYSVGEVTDRSCPSFRAGATLAEIIDTIAETDAVHYPVVSGDRELAGVITIQELKDVLGARGIADWLVAFDLMQPVPDAVGEDAPLEEAVTRMREQGLEYLPVVAGEGDRHLVGMLELRAVDRLLSREVVRRQRLADAAAGEA